MIPTSLDVASFLPAGGPSPSQISSFSSYSQNSANEGAEQGTSFRQVMNSYTRSQDSGHAEEQAARSEHKTEDSQDDTTRSNESASAADQQSAAPQTNSSFTGRFGLGQKAADEAQAAGGAEASAEQAATDENTAAGTTPQTGTATAFTGLSALQLLLKGGSVSTLTPANQTAAAGNDAAKLLAAKSAAAGLLAAAGKIKADDLKRKSEADGAATPDLTALAANAAAVTPEESAAEAAAGNGTAQAKTGLAIGAMTPEQLQLRAAGQSEKSAATAANNFAFAVRLSGENAAAAQTDSNDAASQSPLTLAADAQSALLTSGLVLAEQPGGEHAGEHQAGQGGEGTNEGALLFGAEAAPAEQTSSSSSTSAAPEAAPVTAAEPEQTASTQPVRNVHLQLAGENNQRVDIRLVEVAGEMRVSVRAGDTKLAQTLQEHVPDLSNRLNQQAVRAEIWSPRTENTAQSNSSNQSGQRDGDSSDSSNRGGQQGQRQGNGRQQQNQPDWVDELENYSSRTTTFLRSN